MGGGGLGLGGGSSFCCEDLFKGKFYFVNENE